MIARLILILLVCCSGSILAQEQELKFEHLTKEDGLSSSDVTGIVQDKQGFIWIGTIDGLNRYDGYTIKTYRNIPEEAGSLCDNKISVLYVDSQGELWIGTENKGLSRYDRNTDSFIHYPYDAFSSKSLSYYYVTSIVEDANQNLWVGTLSGLNRFDRKTQQFTQYFRKVKLRITPETLSSLKEQKLPTEVLAAVAHLQEKNFSSGEQFLASLKQLITPKQLGQYQKVILESVVLETDAERIRSLEAGKKGTLWLGFEQQGLGHFDPAQETLSRFRHAETNPNTLSNDEILSLEADGDQLWIGTRGGGLNRYDTRRGLFYRYPFTRETIHIKSVLKDSEGQVWFGDSEGLNRYNKQTDSFYRYQQYADEDQGLTTLFVSALFQDAQGNLWVGCDQGGVNIATLHQSFKHLSSSAGNPKGLSKKKCFLCT